MSLERRKRVREERRKAAEERRKVAEAKKSREFKEWRQKAREEGLKGAVPEPAPAPVSPAAPRWGDYYGYPGGPFLPLNSEIGPKIIFPDRDLEPSNNYLPEMWDLIKESFPGGEPKVAVEVGSRRGAWASGLMQRTCSTRLFCVDIWATKVGGGNLRAWMARVGQWAFTRAFPLKGSSLFWGMSFPYEFDLVFVDAEHDGENARRDFSLWYRLLAPGGLFIGHDYQLADVKVAACRVFGEENLTIGRLGMGKAVSFWLRKPENP